MGDRERYSFSLTTFSPSGKLMQIEYAMNAVQQGAPCVGVRATNGVVLATEKKFKSFLIDEESIQKIEPISKQVGMVYSGMSADYRVIVKAARKAATQYRLQYGSEMPTAQLTNRVALLQQEFTQSGGVRPFGVSLLIAGVDTEVPAHGGKPSADGVTVEKRGESRPLLFQSDPSGAYFAWKSTALGKNHINGKTFLEKRYSETMELEDAIHTAILVLKEGFEGEMNETNIEIGVARAEGFRRLSAAEVKDYLAAVQ